MADPFSNRPTEENVKAFRDFVNLQKEMNDHLMAEKHLYYQIGKINLDVEAKIKDRRQKEHTSLVEIRGLMGQIQQMEKQKSDLGPVELKVFNKQIEAIQTQIKQKQKFMSLLKEVDSIEIAMEKKKYDEENRWFTFASKNAKALFGIKVQEFDTVKGISEELMKTDKITGGVATIVATVLMMLQGAYKLFLTFDKAAWEFRKAMGMTRIESQAIRSQAEGIAIEFMHIGVTIEGSYKATQNLGRVMGGVHNVSKELAENVSIMAAQLGVSEENSTLFLRNMAVISKNTMESQQNMMYLAQFMSAAYGVPLNDIMKDVGTHSEHTLTMMSRLPNIALKSAIELRRMGTSLDASSKSSRHLLDFTENIQEEMEASVLLGRSINLQRARELAYRRDLVGSTKEILRITKSVNFEKLDPFQMDAFAKATGRSVDELLGMLQADKQIENVRRSGTPDQQKQLKTIEAMRKANDATLKAQAKSVEIQLRAMGNQTQIARLQQNWNQLLAKVQQVLLPVIDKTLGFINDHFKAIKWIAIVIGGIWLANKLLLIAQNSQLILQGILLRKNALFSGQLGEKLVWE